MKSLQVRRLYKAGDYANVEFTESIDNIPDELANDLDYMKHLENLMLLGLDRKEHKYFRLRESMHDLQAEERAKLDSISGSHKEPKNAI
jgi:hypothetical protein